MVLGGSRRLAPTSIIPHTSVLAGEGESGAHLVAGFVLADVHDLLRPACKTAHRNSKMQFYPKREEIHSIPICI